MAALTADQRRTLILHPSRDVSAQLEIVGPDLQFRRDLTDRLQPGGSVEWTGASRVHRTCSITVALASDSDVDWRTELLRLSMTITAGGVTARVAVGTFQCARPDRSAGTVSVDQFAGPLTAYQLSGQDVTSLLDRQVGYSYSLNSAGGTVNVLNGAVQVLSDAGFPASTVLVDSSRQGVVLTQDGTWPWFQTNTSDDADAGAGAVQPKDVSGDGDSGPATWRTVVNDTVGQVVYRAVWADGNGYLRLTPYLDAANAPATFDWSAIDPLYSSISVDRSSQLELSQFNKVTYVWTNMPGDVVPSYGNGGLYDLTDDADIAARGGAQRGTDPTQVQLQAATVDDFQAQAAADFATQRRAVVTVSAKTVPYPLAGHFDVHTLGDPALLGRGPVKVQATKWTLPLDGSPMSWEWTVIS